MSQIPPGLTSWPPREPGSPPCVLGVVGQGAGQDDPARDEAQRHRGLLAGRRSLVVFSFWLVLAFVTWNVIFDRHVSVAAVAFTREQTGNHLAGRPLVSIDDGFAPHVRVAAARASLWAGAIVALGALAAWRAGRSPRSHPSSPPR